jgi:hypothetical protein
MHTASKNPRPGRFWVHPMSALGKLLSKARSAMTKPLTEEGGGSWLDWPRFPPF